MTFSRSLTLIAALTLVGLLAGHGDARAEDPGVSPSTGPWATPEASAQYFTELQEFFKGAEVRFPGSDGNTKTEEKVAQLFAASGFDHGAIRFQTPVFVPGKSSVAVGGTTYALQPLHPSLMRPGNFKETAFKAPLIYLGRGQLEDLAAIKGTELSGSVVVLDFNCGINWVRLLRFGVKGFIFLPSGHIEGVDAYSKVYDTETAVPRFAVSEDDGKKLIAALKTGTIDADFNCEPSIWKNTYLRDPWVLVPGADATLKNDVCVIYAPLDSNAIIPERAAGAQAGANLFLLTQLLKAYKAMPPARSVILVAVNAHTQNYLGERMLATHLCAPMKDLDTVRDMILQDMRLEEMYASHYRNLSELVNKAKDAPNDAAAKQAVEDLLVTLREQIDTSTGKQLPVKRALLNKIEPAANLAKSREVDAEKSQQAKIDYQRLLSIEMLFNKYGRTKKFSDLTADEVEILSKNVDEVLNGEVNKAKLNQADLDQIEANNAIRVALQGRNVTWALSLQMSWNGKSLGFSSGSSWGNPDWRNRYGAKLMEMSAELPGVKAGRKNPLVDTMTFNGGLPESYYFAAPGDLMYIQTSQKTPALALLDVFAFGDRIFTPEDTFSRLDAQIVGSQSAYVQELLRSMLATDVSGLGKPNPNGRTAWPLQIKTLQFDKFSSAVLPEVLVSNAFVQLRNVSVAQAVVGDVVQAYSQLTDERATVTFYCINHYVVHVLNNAFQMDKDYREVLQTVDGGEKEATLTSNFAMNLTSQSFVMFQCREFPILTRDNPALIAVSPIAVTDFRPLDGKRESPPQKMGASGLVLGGSGKRYTTAIPTSSFPGSLYIDPTAASVKILTQVPALNSTTEQPEGIGYDSPQQLGPDYFAAAARDLDALNRFRLGRLHGVSIELASDFMKQGKAHLDEAAAKRKANDYTAYLQAQHTAMGAERQAYLQLAGTTNDMLRGVIFYMALILPFCFFMQKLLFNVVKIEAQIGAFFGLFVLAYVLFREIHPAFAIAKAPEGILIAFVMGGLATFVVKILHGRFEGEMTLLFQNFAGHDGADVGYGTVGQKAMLIGVNNMRRRRVRTALTTATIVLITFTMLSFTSISQTMSPTTVSVSKDIPPYTGLMYHWPGKRMDEASLTAFREMFYGKGDINVRRWMLQAQYDRMVQPFVAEAPSGKTVRIESVLGLSMLEDGFLGRMPLLAGHYFTSDRADEVLIPNSIAEVLGITKENIATAKIHFRDVDFTVAGIVDDESFRRMKDIDGYLLVPQKEGAADPAAVPGAGGEAGAAKDQTGLYNDTSTMLILPVERAERMGATPYSISIRFNAENQDVWKNVLHLLTETQANFYIASQAPFKASGSEDQTTKGNDAQTMSSGVYYIGSGFKTAVGNLASLIIPLLISGTIILNTMLGSVFERKREIAIYNAIGLNPNHIGMFFLSEAFVYGIVGSVGGYLIGQFLSILLIHLGITGIDLNFASLKVIYVILFTISMVLVSTLYPAIVATRAAVPSGKRKWSFPEHDGHTMKTTFPFIYHPEVVSGVVGYLEEYFARFTEASMGDLIASHPSRNKGKDDKGRDTYSLSYDLALAPFDLGVTQRVTFTAAYDERVQSYGIMLTTVRVSGQDTNWVTTNKPFLEKLRTYLMHWRSLSKQEQSAYALAAEESMKVVSAGPVA